MITTATTTATTATGHAEDCMCVKCLMADMDSHLASRGLDPFAYAQEVLAAEPERTRYATPGQACGRGKVRHASPAQVALIKRLMAERDTTNLVRLPGSEDVESMSLAGARDLIDRLLACPVKPGVGRRDGASPKALDWAATLAAKKGLGVTREELAAKSAKEVSAFIDMAKVLPDAAKKETPAVTEGMYRDPATGDIFKVQVAHHGSGNLYAKKLVELEEAATKRGKSYSHEFQYVAGAIRRIQPEWKMTLEEAKEWGSLYGACCNCGAVLTDEKSISAGIGPVCATKF